MNELASLWVYPLRPGETLANQDWFEMHTHKFLTSRFLAYALRDGRRDLIGTALILWAECYRQDPAGTLPDDDVELAQLARYGSDVAAWVEVRDRVLLGWEPCHIETDRVEPAVRLGHRLIAEIAVRSFHRKAGKAAARDGAKLASAKHKVRAQMEAVGQGRAARVDAVVEGVARWLLANSLWVTRDNVASALATVAGIETGNVVTHPAAPRG